ncbi:MAG TPA: GAF domain-containing protein, partial [bacterium]|nr:GAF domain-containing protein [bacterium]
MKDKPGKRKTPAKPSDAPKADSRGRRAKDKNTVCSPRKLASSPSNSVAVEISRLVLVGSELAAIEDLMDLCRRAVELGRSELGFERLAIWLVEDAESDMIRGTFGTDAQGRTRDERDFVIRAPRSRFPLRRIDERVPKAYRKRMKRLVDWDKVITGGADTLSSVITDGQKLIGYLVADTLISAREFSQGESEIFAFYASILGHLMQSRISGQVLQEQNRQLELLNTITSALSGSRTPEQMGTQLFEIVRDLVACDSFILCQYDSQQQKLKAVVAYDTIDGEWTELQRGNVFLNPTEDIRQMCFRREPLVVLRQNPELDSHGWKRNGDASRPSASLVFIPIISTDRVVGYYSVQSYTLNAYSQADVALLT